MNDIAALAFKLLANEVMLRNLNWNETIKVILVKDTSGKYFKKVHHHFINNKFYECTNNCPICKLHKEDPYLRSFEFSIFIAFDLFTKEYYPIRIPKIIFNNCLVSVDKIVEISKYQLEMPLIELRILDNKIQNIEPANFSLDQVNAGLRELNNDVMHNLLHDKIIF